MEQIFGSLDDEYIQNEESEVVFLSYDSFLIDGSLPVAELIELMGFEPDKADECETAAGLLLNIFDKIPSEGENVSVEEKNIKVTFTVLAMDRRRIDRIGVKIEKHQAEGTGAVLEAGEDIMENDADM